MSQNYNRKQKMNETIKMFQNQFVEHKIIHNASKLFQKTQINSKKQSLKINLENTKSLKPICFIINLENEKLLK